MENKSDKDLIVSTLGNEKEIDRYYVYALCDKATHKPFYIGKGQEYRIWQHEEDFENYKNKISNINSDDFEQIKAISKKFEAIENSNGEVEKVIIKWGLTQNEAFMAESALINMLNYHIDETKGDKKLTNIANGHSSIKEKNSKLKTTQALSIDEFKEQNCKSTLLFKESTCGEENIFININQTYPDCKSESVALDKQNDMIREATKGYRKINENRKIKYVFAVYQNRICGVYEPIELLSKSEDITNIPNFPDNFPNKIFEAEKDLIVDVFPKYKDYDFKNLPMNIKLKFIEYCKKYDVSIKEKILKISKGKRGKDIKFSYAATYITWKQRKYFVLKDAPEDYKNSYIGCIITNNNKSIFEGRNTRRYGTFEVAEQIKD